MARPDRAKHSTIGTERPTPTIDLLLAEARPPVLDVHRELPSVPESVRAARQLVRALLHDQMLDRATCDDVLLAVSEAVTNAVRHAYDGPSGLVELSVQRSGTQLAITISDRGRGLDMPTPRPGLGLGVGLIRKMADHAVFMANRQGGTTVEMQFRLPA